MKPRYKRNVDHVDQSAEVDQDTVDMNNDGMLTSRTLINGHP